jgi:hypothetical protein
MTTLTAGDVRDAKRLVDAAIGRGQLNAADTGALYNSIFIAAAMVEPTPRGWLPRRKKVTQP